MLLELGLREGIEPPSAPNEAMFFAFMPEPAFSDRLLDFGRRTALRANFAGTLMNRARLHMSLHPFVARGGQWEAQLEAADRAVRRMKAGPIRIALDGVSTFNSSHGGKCLVLTVGGDEVTSYYRELGEALVWERLPRGDAAFRPHVTLVRGHGFIEDGPVADLGWTAREVVLIRSFHGEGRYDILGRWPMRGRA